MYRLTIITVLFFLTTTALAQKASERDNVINLIKQFDKAIAKKDSVTLQKILTEDFTGTIPNGESFKKNLFIQYHCNPHSKTRDIKDESTKNWNIKISEGCAIINRVVTYLYKNNEVIVKRLDVCLKIKGKWFVASGQATEVL
jgi:hypothetical protein